MPGFSIPYEPGHNLWEQKGRMEYSNSLETTMDAAEIPHPLIYLLRIANYQTLYSLTW